MKHETWSIDGKHCLISGASSGIGRAAANMLAKQGAEVIIGGRNAERCAVVQEEIKAATGRQAQVFLCDFSSLQSIREAADNFLQQGGKLDVLINNAGIFPSQRILTADGYESAFAVNHLAPFLLTGMLMPRLQEAGTARIVNVSSDAHRLGRLNFEDLQSEKGRFGSFRVYGRSKTCNLLFTASLAAKFKNTGITAYAIHPGGVRTRLGGMDRNPNPLARLVFRIFFRSPEEGADTPVYLASDPALGSESGGYYKNRRPHKIRSYAMDPDNAQKLWEISENLCGFEWPQIPSASSA